MYTIQEIKTMLPDLKHHPAASRLPLMKGDKFEGLKFDLLENGMRNPIWIVDGQILDGRSRYKVLRWMKSSNQLSFEPDIREWNKLDDNFNGIVRSMNIHRNDYDKNQLAAYAARYLVPGLKEEALLRMHKKVPVELFPEVKKGNANHLAALLVGTNEKYVRFACQIKDKNESFLDFVMNKLMSLKDGIEFIEMEIDERHFIFEQMKSGKKYKEAKTLWKVNKKPESTNESPYNDKCEQHATNQIDDQYHDNVAIYDDSNDIKEFPDEETRKHVNQKNKSTIRSRVQRINKETSQAKSFDIGIVFPSAIHENALEEIAEVLHRHGYSDQSYRILVATNTNEVKDILEPLLTKLAVTAYEVEPQVIVETIDYGE